MDLEYLLNDFIFPFISEEFEIEKEKEKEKEEERRKEKEERNGL